MNETSRPTLLERNIVAALLRRGRSRSLALVTMALLGFVSANRTAAEEQPRVNGRFQVARQLQIDGQDSGDGQSQTGAPPKVDEQPQANGQAKGNFEVHEVSLWILDPGAAQANVRTAYPSALPGLVNSARSTPFPASSRKITPINLIRFYGTPATGLDIDLRTKSGSFLAHWPTGEGLPNRLRWSGNPPVDLVEKAEESEMSFVDADHWIRKARENPALYVRRGARAERFLAYDAEINLAAPVRLEGGPDKYKVVNVSSMTLHDVLISCPTPQGRRIAWIDVLPPGQPLKAADDKKDAAKKSSDKKDGDKKDGGAAVLDAIDAADAKKSADNQQPTAAEQPAAPSGKRSATLFSGIGKKSDDKAADQKSDPKPAEKKADDKKTEEKQPDDKKSDDKKSDDKKSDDKKPDEKKANDKKPAEPARAVISPDVFAKISARARGDTNANIPINAKAPSASPAAAPATPMTGAEITLDAPLAADSPDALAKTTAALSERLSRAGLHAGEVSQFLESYQSLFFEGEAIVVACRLEPAAIDEKIPLSIFPEPTKLTRVAMVVMRNADPNLGQEVLRLIAQLGDPKYAAREAASQRLTQLGSLAFEPLQQALNDADVEIVIRAERILLNQNQTPNPPKPAAAKPAAKAAGAAAAGGGKAVTGTIQVAPAR